MAFALLLAASIGLAACGGPGSASAHSPTPVAAASPTSSPNSGASPTAQASASPSPSPSASASAGPAPVSGAYGVLAGPFSGLNYSVALVGVDGKVVASAQASTPVNPTCAGQAAGLVPYPVSTSNSRAYFMDAKGAVRWVAPDGSKSAGPVITLPVGPSTRSVFAVAPDDSRMAVAVIDFVSGGASTRLFVDDLALGGTQTKIYDETGSYTVWPMGWHAGLIVVAKVASCTQGGGPFCCGPQELHVVDPATATRRVVIGGSGCVIAGASSPGGAVCENSTFTQASEVNWAGGTFNTFPINGPAAAMISPDSNLVAVVNTGTNVTNVRVGMALNGMEACEWIDSSHLLSGGDAQSQPKVGDEYHDSVVPVTATGDCAGRIPGAL